MPISFKKHTPQVSGMYDQRLMLCVDSSLMKTFHRTKTPLNFFIFNIGDNRSVDTIYPMKYLQTPTYNRPEQTPYPKMAKEMVTSMI